MRSTGKKYNTAYKKKVDVDRDTFLPRRLPKNFFESSGKKTTVPGRQSWERKPDKAGEVMPLQLQCAELTGACMI